MFPTTFNLLILGEKSFSYAATSDPYARLLDNKLVKTDIDAPATDKSGFLGVARSPLTSFKSVIPAYDMLLVSHICSNMEQ